jgi:hypothetical protein
MVVKAAMTLSAMLALTYNSNLKINIFEIREDLSSIMLQDCGHIDNYASWMDWKAKDQNLSTGPMTTDTDGDTDIAKIIAKMSGLEHIFNLLCRIPRNNKWKVFLERVMDKNAIMTATPNEIVTKLVKKEAAIKRENGLAPEALLFAKKVGRGGRGGNVGKSTKSDNSEDRRDNNDDTKEKDFRKCFHCQW